MSEAKLTPCDGCKGFCDPACEVESAKKRIQQLQAELDQHQWVSVETRSPPIGEPILVVANGVTQNITYMFDGGDESETITYWYEPYHFGMDDPELMIPAHKVSKWMPLPSSTGVKGE